MFGHNQPKTGLRRRVARATSGIEERKPLPATSLPVTVAQLETHTYDDGLRAGVQARLRSSPITPYQRVGLDDFARGFRAGYFKSRGRGPQVVDALGGRAAS